MRGELKHRVSLRLPESTLKQLRTVGRDENRGLSNTVDTLLLRALGLAEPHPDYRQRIPPLARPKSRRSKA